MDRPFVTDISDLSQSIQAPILLIHSMTDPDIPSSHSLALFDGLLETELPPLPFSTADLTTASKAEWDQQQDVLDERRTLREKLVGSWQIDGFGKYSYFDATPSGEGLHPSRRVGLLQTTGGGHVKLLGYEGVIDLIGQFLDL